MIPNVSWSWLSWEADLISITKAGYMYEYEIKISKSDFMHDFGKPKHRSLRRAAESPRIPNYFSYVAPINAIPLCIPDYAGLIEISPSGRYGHTYDLEIIRKPPKIQGAKQTDASKIKMLKTLMFKYWGLANTLNNNKIQKELFAVVEG